MGLMAKGSNETSTAFETCPAGNHLALCYAVIDLGMQERDWQGEVSVKRRVRISWELAEELMTDGRPFSASKEYTLSLNEKATLRHDLEGWRGRAFTEDELAGFDLANVLGKPCLVNVVHQQKRDGTGFYAKVIGITRIPKGMSITGIPKVNVPLWFSLDEPDAADKYALLPEWLQKRITLRAVEPDLVEDEPQEINDDIPF